jgi:hypothetical protein
LNLNDEPTGHLRDSLHAEEEIAIRMRHSSDPRPTASTHAQPASVTVGRIAADAIDERRL